MRSSPLTFFYFIYTMFSVKLVSLFFIYGLYFILEEICDSLVWKIVMRNEKKFIAYELEYKNFAPIYSTYLKNALYNFGGRSDWKL